MGTEKRSVVSCIGLPPPRSWSDYRDGCHGTFGGGHRTEETIRAFHHGMDTVFNLLESEFPSAETCKAAPDLLAACQEFLPILERQLASLGMEAEASNAFQVASARVDRMRNAIASASPSEPVVHYETTMDDL